MNDMEREQWVDNDEWLYNEHRRSRKSKKQWIKENREMIDGIITRALYGPARY